MESDKAASRRRYSEKQKLQVMAECDATGNSVAKVAMAHGINANVVHRWRQAARGGVRIRRGARPSVVACSTFEFPSVVDRMNRLIGNAAVVDTRPRTLPNGLSGPPTTGPRRYSYTANESQVSGHLWFCHLLLATLEISEMLHCNKCRLGDRPVKTRRQNRS